MSELPELPRPPRSSVAPHPDGASGAAARGRQRRRRGAVLGSGAAAVVAVVVSVVLLLPGNGDPREGLIAGGGDAPVSGPVGRPVIQTAAQMDVCDASRNCRRITGNGAVNLSRALQSAQRAPADAVYCQALGPTYNVRLRSPDTTQQDLVVRLTCGPMTVDAEEFLLDEAVAQRVARAHKTGEVDPPLIPRGVSAARFCSLGAPQLLPARRGGGRQRIEQCSGIEERVELDRFSDLVSAGGKLNADSGGCAKTGERVNAVVSYPDGSTIDLSADTVCGPLGTQTVDYVLVAAARERYFTIPTFRRAPNTAFSPGPDSSVDCRWEASQLGAQQPARRDVGWPSTAAPQTDRRAVLVTNRGRIGLTLVGSRTPCTVHSFAHLAGKGYYDDTSCHRLTTKGIFVVQCGDPTATGVGGPGYQFADEALSGVTYPRGTLAMVNSGADTNGSQFFMTYADTELPPNYTVFGRLDHAGVQILEEIAAAGTEPDGDGKPNRPVTITRVELP